MLIIVTFFSRCNGTCKDTVATYSPLRIFDILNSLKKESLVLSHLPNELLHGWSVQ